MKKSHFRMVLGSLIVLLILIKGVYLLSLTVLGFKNAYEEIIADENMDVSLPGGLSTFERDWYPFVSTFNAQGIGRYVGEDISLVVKFNFGAFKGNSSLFFDSESKYYNSFYGCYIIKENGDKSRVLMSGGSIDLNKIEKIARYDLEKLVMNSIGCHSINMKFELLENSVSSEFREGEIWERIDSMIVSNGPQHDFRGFQPAYLQYGIPQKKNGEDFEIMEFYSRMYGKYFADKKTYLLFYVISPDLGVVETTDLLYLRKAVIR
ncbi:hypothetical protein [Alkalibacter mobilis]|uniref:hypothetical protein n=1 Tax=Alkalibacter mobilis TaxID=2787712 RepID=UPI00189FDAFD|nr:hypothetical protein [Alkalibacter mobilis]MBF7097186.1 hypothetical protein [Alkalibacter mobilis]